MKITKTITCFLIIFVMCQFEWSNGANILGIFALPFDSHQAFFRLIWKELALRGHNVTVIATRPLHDSSIKNLKEIDISFSFKVYEEIHFVEEVQEVSNIFKYWSVLANSLKKFGVKQLSDPGIQALIKDNNTHFDVVLAEFALPAFFYMSELFDCPLILMSSMPINCITSVGIGNPLHPLILPDANLPFGKTLSYKERLLSVINYIWSITFVHYAIYSASDEVIKECLGVETNLAEIEKKRASLVIANDVPELSNVHLKMPNVIEIHGINLKPPAPLPKDLKEFLDNGTEGVIYFSLGTLVLSDVIKDRLQIAEELFCELPYKVVWKLDVDSVIVDSKNIFARHYFESQQDILRHPNVKVFITQGGLHSLEEAIAYHVPIIGAPFIGDQKGNIRKMVDSGMGIEIDLHTATKEDIKSAILEVMNNPKYLERVKEVSKYMFDRPMKPMDEIVWWIDYVIRHKGAYHLRSPLQRLSWNELFLLDALFTIISVCAVLFYVSYKLLKVISLKLIYLTKFRKSKTE